MTKKPLSSTISYCLVNRTPSNPVFKQRVALLQRHAQGLFNNIKLSNPQRGISFDGDISYEAIQDFCIELRKEMHLPLGIVVKLSPLLKKLSRLGATIVPVFWDESNAHERGLAITCQSSKRSFIFINLNAHTADVKYWLTLQLGRTLFAGKDSSKCDDFASMFARSFLFGDGAALDTYKELITKSNFNIRGRTMRGLAAKFMLPLEELYQAICEFAIDRELDPLQIVTRDFPYLCRQFRDRPTLLNSFLQERNLTAGQYLRICEIELCSQWRKIMEENLINGKITPAMLSEFINCPLQDAVTIYKESYNGTK